MEKALVHNGVTYTYFTWAIKNAIGLSSALEDVATMLAATPCRHILPTLKGGNVDGENDGRRSAYLSVGQAASNIYRVKAAELVVRLKPTPASMVS